MTTSREPMHIGDSLFRLGGARGLLSSLATGGPTADQQGFPFERWAAAVRFKHHEWQRPFYLRCESAAEAFFLQGFLERGGARVARDGVLTDDSGLLVKVQVPTVMAKYRADFTVRRGVAVIAAEVDGLQFHQRTPEQVAADYLRMRRMMLAGFAIARFTAQEAMSDPSECWRQLEAIVTAIEAREARD